MTEKLTFDEFKNIPFKHPIPNLAIDFVKYLTDYDMFKPEVKIPKTPNFESLDNELNDLRNSIGESGYQVLFSGFTKLSENPEAVFENQIYITQNSIHSHFTKIFGEYSEFF